MTEQEQTLINTLASILADSKRQADNILDENNRDWYMLALIDVRYDFARVVRSIYGNNAAIDFHEKITS